MTILRFFGAIALVVLLVAYVHHWDGAHIVAWLFWLGCGVIAVWLLSRMIGRHW